MNEFKSQRIPPSGDLSAEVRVASRIVLVDDDVFLAESLGENLRHAGYWVQSFTSGEQCLAYFEEGGSADLLLLDWRMDGISGIDVLKKLRGAGKGVTAVFLTGLHDQMFEEAALAAGAVDFVHKSRSFTILRRRIEALLAKRTPSRKQHPATMAGIASDLQDISLGDLEVDAGSHRAFWRGRLIELTLMEFKLVNTLAANAGTNLTYRQIYDVMRGQGFVAGDGDEGLRGNVRTTIKRIRKKFRHLDDSFDEIRNYPGYGYRWRDPAREGGISPV